MKYPLKHIRLEQLYKAGFNIPNFIYFPPRKLNLDTLKSFFEEHKVISCRHFHTDESKYFACPVIYEIGDWKTIQDFCLQNNKKFYSLCNEALPLQDSTYAGVILLLDRRNYVVEYFEGFGTPRDIESKSAEELRVFKREFGKPLPSETPKSLVEIAGRFYNFLPEERPISLEFSIYPYRVGKLHRQEIFWEWRKGWIHDALEVVHRLWAENQELKITIKTLSKLFYKEL